MVSKETTEKYKSIHTDEWYENLNNSLTKTCSTCKQDKPLTEFSKHRKQADGFNYQCKKCVKISQYKKRGINLAYHKSRAKRRGLEFNITNEDLFLPTHCPILNIELDYFNETPTNNSPSVDRIDNSKGYIKGNVIVMSRLANAMKSNADYEQLKLFTQNILKLMDYYKMQGALGSITDVFPNIKELSLDS